MVDRWASVRCFLGLAMAVAALVAGAGCRRAQVGVSAPATNSTQQRAPDTAPESKKAPTADDYGGIEPATVSAWEKAGARFGWHATGFIVLGSKRPEDVTTIPGFSDWPAQGVKGLPAPAVPFGFYVYQAKVTDADLKDLVPFKHLTRLDLDDTLVTDAGIKELTRLECLEKLSVSESKITDEGLKTLGKLTQLKELYLVGAKVTDKGLRELVVLKNLQRLGLGGTQVTDDGVATLQKALPKLQVDR